MRSFGILDDYLDDFQVLELRLVIKRDRSTQTVLEQIADMLGISIGPTFEPKETVIAEAGHYPANIEDLKQ